MGRALGHLLIVLGISLLHGSGIHLLFLLPTGKCNLRLFDQTN